MTTQDIRNLIAAAKTDKAIEALQQNNNLSSDTKNDIALLAARFNNYKRKKQLGLEPDNELNIELNKINQALLSLIDDIDNRTTNNPPQPENRSNNNKWFLIGTAAIAIIGILANLATVLDYLGIKPKTNDDKPKTVVVYTHGSKGKQDIIQFKTTRLIADINGRRDIAEIHDNGQNVFTEVTSDSISIGIDDKEGYQLKNHKNTYFVSDKPIYVEITKSEATRLLKGVIKDDKGNLLEGVEIATLGETALSEKTGYFELKIPDNKLQNAYPLTLSKEGYMTGNETYIPLSQIPEYRLKKVK